PDPGRDRESSGASGARHSGDRQARASAAARDEDSALRRRGLGRRSDPARVRQGDRRRRRRDRAAGPGRGEADDLHAGRQAVHRARDRAARASGADRAGAPVAESVSAGADRRPRRDVPAGARSSVLDAPTGSGQRPVRQRGQLPTATEPEPVVAAGAALGAPILSPSFKTALRPKYAIAPAISEITDSVAIASLRPSASPYAAWNRSLTAPTYPGPMPRPTSDRMKKKKAVATARPRSGAR